MRILDLLTEDFIIPDLQASSKLEVLKEFSHIVGELVSSLEEEDIFRVLLDRERLGSTGVGNGIAVPHARLGSLQRPVLCFGRSLQGVDFDAVDGKPVHLFFVLLTPNTNSGLHIKILAKIAYLLKNDTVRRQLEEARDKEEIMHIIMRNDSDF